VDRSAPVLGSGRSQTRIAHTMGMSFSSKSAAAAAAVHPPTARSLEQPLAILSSVLLRYGLVAVIAWIGALKYTASEAARIQPFIEHSPFMSWMNTVLSQRTLSGVLGTVELLAAVLIAVRPWLPRASVAGSAIATLLFLGTLSFLFTTPGVTDDAAGGFPALSFTGQFLLKDLVLLGAAVWTLSDSLRAAERRR
jgi:reactive chlorine resistance protein C